ncbi:PREDICTED: splicing factor 3B subunit 4-like, partial [Acropora digitifera]|uniref:splicing factor 3B subunit 4-like n=1 Tax=Acropora digitifera TaxID=70779 RepID=UPI00077A6A29
MQQYLRAAVTYENTKDLGIFAKSSMAAGPIAERNQGSAVCNIVMCRVCSCAVLIPVFQSLQMCNAYMHSYATASAHNKNLDVGANIFIGNLDPEIDEKLLYDTFSAFGVILQTPKIMRDPETGNSKGFAFINFASFDASDAAMEAMNGQYLCNRPITISYAFKKESKGERHGSAAERLLAAQNPLAQADRPHQLFADAPPTPVSAVPPPAPAMMPPPVMTIPVPHSMPGLPPMPPPGGPPFPPVPPGMPPPGMPPHGMMPPPGFPGMHAMPGMPP